MNSILPVYKIGKSRINLKVYSDNFPVRSIDTEMVKGERNGHAVTLFINKFASLLTPSAISSFSLAIFASLIL